MDSLRAHSFGRCAVVQFLDTFDEAVIGVYVHVYRNGRHVLDRWCVRGEGEGKGIKQAATPAQG